MPYQVCFRQYRSSRHRRDPSSFSKPDPHRNLALCVTQILTARRSSTSWRKYCRAFKEDAAIYTPLFHHLLVYTTLFHLALSSFEDPQASSTNAFLPEVIEQMQKVINRTASMNEEVAADMGEVVSQLPTLSESAE